MKNNTVKLSNWNKGFSFTETLYTLLIFVNLFVLITQIFYNINIEAKLKSSTFIFDVEVVLLRMENDLREGSIISLKESDLTYSYRELEYRYYVFNNRLTLRIKDGTSYRYIYYLYNVKDVRFSLLTSKIIEITVTNTENVSYKGRIYDA